ncbi:FAD synthase [Acrasis kona]|uniref:FAD synthase n=1 Tax=Acrasis kona TaxID=1008807 RepID=A0AAW2ZF80_9EUKA
MGEETSWWKHSDALAFVEQELRLIRTNIHDKEKNVCESDIPIFDKVKLSVDIITQAFDKYGYLALGYNGGKDSIVLVNLVIMSLIHQAKRNRAGEHSQCTPHDVEIAFQQLREKVLCFHFLSSDSFVEMDEFIQSSSKLYNVQVMLVDGTKGYKCALEEIVRQYPQFKGVLMGTRRIDPHGENMRYFEPTTKGWPDMMRVSPVLEWDYCDIWHLLRGLSIPYCSLYDSGYTSLGCTKDTLPNPLLKKDNGEYTPAYTLLDGSMERAGRKGNQI